MMLPAYPPPVDPQNLGRGPAIMGLTWAFTSLATITVSLRFLVRVKFVKSLGLDDWLMLFALIFDLAFQSVLSVAYHFGMGKHDASLTPYQVTEVLKWMWVCTPVGLVASLLARISIAILLVKLFGVHRWFKWFAILVTSCIAILTIAVIPCTFLQVTPISGNWNPFEPSRRWSKHIYVDISYLGQSLSTFADLTFVLFPVMIICRLRMPLRDRVGIVLLLSASLLTMIMSILNTVSLGRIQAQQSDPHARNVLYDGVLVLLYRGLEQSLVITMGCVPTLRAVTKLQLGFFSDSLVSIIRHRKSSKSSSMVEFEVEKERVRNGANT